MENMHTDVREKRVKRHARSRNGGACYFLEHFSIEIRQTKTIVITTTNRKKGKQLKEPVKPQSKTTKIPKARENAGEPVVIGFSFASDWLKEWSEFSGPIIERRRGKTKTPSDHFQHSVDNFSFCQTRNVLARNEGVLLEFVKKKCIAILPLSFIENVNLMFPGRQERRSYT